VGAQQRRHRPPYAATVLVAVPVFVVVVPVFVVPVVVGWLVFVVPVFVVPVVMGVGGAVGVVLVHR